MQTKDQKTTQHFLKSYFLWSLWNYSKLVKLSCNSILYFLYPLRRLSRVFCSLALLLALAPAYCFSKRNLRFCFSRSLKAIKRQWARFGLSFAIVNIIKMIFVIKLRLHEGRRLPSIIWICLWFSSICFGEISKFSQFVEIVLPIH